MWRSCVKTARHRGRPGRVNGMTGRTGAPDSDQDQDQDQDHGIVVATQLSRDAHERKHEASGVRHLEAMELPPRPRAWCRPWPGIAFLRSRLAERREVHEWHRYRFPLAKKVDEDV
ncbi:hypothetical protein E4U41_006403 [Claviceps citrina]|nr:hypothetical protein E4U41_006403 [Claviceps citrina]